MPLAGLLGDVDASLRDILAREVPWEAYATARLITEKDASLIRRYDKRSPELRSSMLSESGPVYIESLLSVLKAVTKDDTCQYVLALLLQLVAEDPHRASLFHQQSSQYMAAAMPDPYPVLMRLLSRNDWPTQEMAARLLVVVLESRPVKRSDFAVDVMARDAGAAFARSQYDPVDSAEPHISVFVDWLMVQLRRPSSPARSVPLAASCLATMLRERSSRALMMRAGGVQVLPPLLRAVNTPANTQLLYELCLCVWQLTFSEAGSKALAGAGAVRALVGVARAAQKEKVLRVAVSALANLLGHARLGLGGEMVAAGAHRVVAARMQQHWSDDDVASALERLEAALQAHIAQLSSFELFKKEVLSGALDWSPMHTSDAFWRDNIEKFESNDFQVVRLLLKLVEASRDPRTVAVACSDLGMFITHHGQGRYIVNGLQGKETVMRHMASADPEVQKQALLCVQRMMLSKAKLEFLRPAPAS